MPLVKFALPVLAAIFLQTMYGAVDMLVVGSSPRQQMYRQSPQEAG